MMALLLLTSFFEFDTARALYRAEQYRLALKHLDASEAAGEVAPLRPLYRGMSLAQLGRWQAAADVLDPVVQSQPTNSDAWYWLGASRYYLNRLEQAYASLNKALELRPEDADAYRMRGLVHIKQNRWNEGYRDWLKAARLNPRDVKTRYYLGRLFQEAEQKDQAKLWLTEALKISPNHFEAMTYLAMCEDDTNRATELFRSAIRTSFAQKQPYSWAYLGLGQLHRRLDRTDHARQVLEEGVRVAPEPHLLNELAKLLLAVNETAEAERLLRRVLEQDSTISQAHYQLARLLSSTGRQEQAKGQMELFRQAKEAETNKPKVKVAIR